MASGTGSRGLNSRFSTWFQFGLKITDEFHYRGHLDLEATDLVHESLIRDLFRASDLRGDGRLSSGIRERSHLENWVKANGCWRCGVVRRNLILVDIGSSRVFIPGLIGKKTIATAVKAPLNATEAVQFFDEEPLWLLVWRKVQSRTIVRTIYGQCSCQC